MAIIQHPVVQDVADTAGFGDSGCHWVMYTHVCGLLVLEECVERLPGGQATSGGGLRAVIALETHS